MDSKSAGVHGTFLDITSTATGPQDSKVGSIQLEQLGFMVGKTLYSGNYYYS